MFVLFLVFTSSFTILNINYKTIASKLYQKTQNVSTNLPEAVIVLIFGPTVFDKWPAAENWKIRQTFLALPNLKQILDLFVTI